MSKFKKERQKVFWYSIFFFNGYITHCLSQQQHLHNRKVNNLGMKGDKGLPSSPTHALNNYLSPTNCFQFDSTKNTFFLIKVIIMWLFDVVPVRSTEELSR